MGAWGHGSFENDDALDWVGNELEEASDLSPVSEALRTVADWSDEEYLELPECGAAVAAAEVVAALRGAPPPKVPDTVKDWLGSHRLQASADLVAIALKAIARVRTKSEMQELWEESPEVERWRQALSDLEARLRT